MMAQQSSKLIPWTHLLNIQTVITRVSSGPANWNRTALYAGHPCSNCHKRSFLTLHRPLVAMCPCYREVKWAGGSLKFSVYQKPMHTDHHLQFDSHNDMEHKMGVIRIHTCRANIIITKEEDKEKEFRHTKKVQNITSYYNQMWQAHRRKKYKINTSLSLPQYPTQSQRHCHPTLCGGITEPINRMIIIRKEVAAHAQSNITIGGILVVPKDSDNPDCQVVCKSSCKDRDGQYVGQTERALKTRIKAHTRDLSPIGHHMSFHQHNLDQCQLFARVYQTIFKDSFCYISGAATNIK